MIGWCDRTEKIIKNNNGENDVEKAVEEIIHGCVGNGRRRPGVG
jgi:hypothetical protein